MKGGKTGAILQGKLHLLKINQNPIYPKKTAAYACWEANPWSDFETGEMNPWTLAQKLPTLTALGYLDLTPTHATLACK